MKRTFQLITALALLVAASGVCGQVTVPRTIQINTGDDGTAVALETSGKERGSANSPLPLQQLPSAMRITPITLPSSRSSSYDPCLGKARLFLETGAVQGGNRTNDPTAFVLPDRLNLVDITESTTAPLWYEFNRPGYSGERGSITPYAASLKRPRIRLSNLQITIQSSDTRWATNILGAAHRFNDINYGLNTVGVIYLNGVNTNGGVTLVTSGPPTQLVDEIRFTGYSSDFVANTPQERDNVFNFVEGQPTPFKVIVRYDLFADDGSILMYAIKVWSITPYQAVRPNFGIMRVCDGVGDCQLQVTFYGDRQESYTIQSSTSVDRGWADYLTVNCSVGATVFYIPVAGSARYFK